MRTRILSIFIAISIVLPSQAWGEALPKADDDVSKWTDAMVVAAVIAGSIAAYKAMGKPCACPEDVTSSGRRCGGNSAWSRAGGFKPLCYPTDVSASMVQAYRKTRAIPRP